MNNRAEQVSVIRPKTGRFRLDLAEIWAYRDLGFHLVLREIQVKYKQTAIGVAWAVLQPLVSMLIFTLFFGRLAKMPSDGLPYAVFALIALLPWTYFATALQFSSTSLVANQQMIQKVYFPRVLLPAGSVFAALLDLLIAFAMLSIVLVAYGFHPSARWLWLPAFIALAAASALGFSLWLSAINVKYRDVQFAVPFLIQVWLFATPVVYPTSIIPERWRFLMGLNPMATVVEGFRWSLVNKDFPSWGMAAMSMAVCAVVFAVGLAYFRRTEDEFADFV